MENIFKNACFGKMYKTRNNKKAIFDAEFENNVFGYALLIEDTDGVVSWFRCDGRMSAETETVFDIVSEWQPEISEEEYEEQKEKICGNCIFLKGTFCKYFGEYREPYYNQKEHDCFEPYENL